MERTKKRKLNYKKIGILVLGIIITLLVLIKLITSLVYLIGGRHIESTPETIVLDAQSDYDFARNNDKILYVNSQGLKVYDFGGEYKSDAVYQLSDPFIHTEGKYQVISDIGTSKLFLLKNNKSYTDLKLKEPVLFAKVNEKGFVSAVTSEKGYKSSITVFDKKGKEKFTWHSGDGYIIDCIVTGSKKLAVLSFKEDKDVVTSAVTWFDFSKSEPLGQVILSDCFAYKLVVKGNKAYVIASDGIYSLNKEKVLKTVSFQGRELLGFDTDENGNFVTAQRISNTKSLVVKYNKRMKQIRERELDFEAFNLNCNGKEVVLSGQNNIVILSKGLSVKAKGTVLGETEDILISHDGKKVASFSENAIDIFSVKLGRN